MTFLLLYLMNFNSFTMKVNSWPNTMACTCVLKLVCWFFTDSFSDSFWQKPSELNTDDVTGESPHSDEAIVVEHDTEEFVLVDMGESDSTGLLVDISEGDSPQRESPTPRVAKIFSLDEEAWSGNHDDDTILVKTTSDESSEVKKETKPVRPAPPKPSARRSKSMREGKPVPPVKPLFKKGTTGNLQTPTSPPSGDNERTPMIIISTQRTKTTQRYIFLLSFVFLSLYYVCWTLLTEL